MDPLVTLGRGCSTEVAHMPRRRSLLLSFPTFLGLWSALNQVPQGGACISILFVVKAIKWMPSCVAWGKPDSIS